MHLRLNVGERESYSRRFAASSEGFSEPEREAYLELSDEQAEELANWLNKRVYGVKLSKADAG